MREIRITTGVAAALLAAGCGQSRDQAADNGWTADYDTAVCVDKEGKRVPDADCPRQQVAGTGSGGGHIGASPFLWYYLGRQSALPYYGDAVRGGSFVPASGHVYGSAPAAMGMTRAAAISRGGFGTSARAFGGGRS